MMHHHSSTPRRGTALLAMVVAMVIIGLIVVRIVFGGARDHDLTVKRLDTIRAFYAAEAGANMAIREWMIDDDDDGDGTIGTISDDANAVNDPTLGQAQVFVRIEFVGAGRALTSQGRSGSALREIQVVEED